MMREDMLFWANTFKQRRDCVSSVVKFRDVAPQFHGFGDTSSQRLDRQSVV